MKISPPPTPNSPPITPVSKPAISNAMRSSLGSERMRRLWPAKCLMKHIGGPPQVTVHASEALDAARGRRLRAALAAVLVPDCG
jgi:hypothetical protein